MKTSVKGIFKLGEDHYRLKVSIGKNPATGKYDAVYETFRGSFPDAKKRLRRLQTDHDKGILIKPGKANLAEYLRSWLNDLVKPNLSARTYQLYSYITNNHIIPNIGACPLLNLKPQLLQHLYAEKQNSGELSNRTIQLIHVVMHKSLKNAVKTGLVPLNIADLVEKPTIRRHEMNIMSESDAHIFLEMAKSGEYYALFYTYLFTGMRRSELLAVRWQDVDLLLCQLSVTRSMQYVNGKKTFKEPKTASSRRMIELSPSTVAVLCEHQEIRNRNRSALGLPALTDDDLIFSHVDGSPYSPDSITHAWMKLIRRCGMKGIRLHDARHSHASWLLKQGFSPKVISERLGHSGIAITLDLYAHTTRGMQREAANKLDDILINARNIN